MKEWKTMRQRSVFALGMNHQSIIWSSNVTITYSDGGNEKLLLVIKVSTEKPWMFTNLLEFVGEDITVI